MDKKGKIVLVSALILVGILIIGMVTAAPRAKKACSDGIDNDGDGYIDLNDPGCDNKNDASELNPNVECDDGSDNDGDSATDMADGGCSSPTDNDETDCGDGVCEGGETSGTCPADCGYPDSCSDTDGGNFPLTFGTTSGYYNNNLFSNDDYCVDPSNIMEYYCNGDYESSQQQSCGTDEYVGSNYCISGDVYRNYTDYLCGSGACSSNTFAILQQDCVTGQYCSSGQCLWSDSCSDTDGGYVPTVFGNVTGYLNQSNYGYSDYCVDNTTIMEYYCSGSYSDSWSSSCAGNLTTICSNGRCI